jgi:peptidoglycan biosynthesis protein MviN/MurJ (putative lipid II flippase)
VVAGRIPGGVIAFQIGQAVSFLPVALSAAPLAAAQLPRLSRNFNEKNETAFRSTFRQSLALARFVALPTGVVFVMISETLVAIDRAEALFEKAPIDRSGEAHERMVSYRRSDRAWL